MKKIRRPSPDQRVSAGGNRPPDGLGKAARHETRPAAGFHLTRSALLLTLVAATSAFAALAPTEWSQRQALPVAAPGLVKVPLPAASFDGAQPNLADLRVIGAAGNEIPYLLDRDPAYREPSLEPVRGQRPKSFETPAGAGLTQVLLETGTKETLDAVDLETSVPFFLKAAHVEISPDGQEWESLGSALPLFRQFGAEQLRLGLNRRTAAFIRITIDDTRSRPVPFNGARLLTAPTRAAPPALVPIGAQITQRDEFAGETVLTVLLAGRHVPLAALELGVSDPLFMRRVTVSVREVRDAASTERLIAGGTLYRVALDGAAARAQLELPVEFTPLTRELLVHIHNGDSPPLAIAGVVAKQHPVNLLFMAPGAASYTLLTGNPQAMPPRYDLAAFAGEMRTAAATEVVPGAPEPMPDYHPRESLGTAPLPDVPLAGAPLDATDWAGRAAIQLSRAGVQELELSVAALARARTDFADLRVMRAGNQIPYVLEQPNLWRALPLVAAGVPNPKHPAVSLWQIRLPQAGVPVRRLVFASTTPLFERQIRIYEQVPLREGGSAENTLAAGRWSRTPEPGVPETRVFDLPERMRTDTLWIETDNGDNPAIALGSVQAVYPVVRVIFKTAETEGFSLAYGNLEAAAPRYDLSLVAGKLLTSPRNAAQLAADNAASAGPGFSLGLFKNRYVFWGALALVVIVLLSVVAKLLPKPPAAQ